MIDHTRARLRLRIDSGKTLPVIWLSLGSVALAEMAARAKPGAIVFDLQHGLWERKALEAAIGSLPHDVSAMVRVSENSERAIGEALDAGAEGVIVPLVETGKQARRAVAAAHYPPKGRRSGGGVRPLQAFPDYFAAAARRTVIAVMIETERGVRNAKKIARTEGLDMVFIGTGDLAISLGSFPDFGLDVLSACAEIHRACRKAFVPCGVFTPGAEMAAIRTSHGYRMVVVANDIDMVAKGFDGAMKAFAAKAPAAPVEDSGRGLPTVRPAG